MPTIALKAHFDGQRILLDEPYPLPPESRLMVLVMPAAVDAEETDWRTLSAATLDRAYGPGEPEYTLADLRPTA